MQPKVANTKVPKKGRAKMPAVLSHYGFELTQLGYEGDIPPDQVVHSIATYLALGTAKALQEQTGTSYDQLAAWKAAGWYPKIVDMLRAEQDAKLDAKLSDVIDKSLDAVIDRLENGDYQFTKLGLARVPISASVATKLLGTVYDKRQLVRGEATKIVREEKTGLQQLQEVLKAIAKEKRPEKVIPGEAERL